MFNHIWIYNLCYDAKKLKKKILIKNWDICMDKKSCTGHCLTDDITVNQWEFGMACIIKTS